MARFYVGQRVRIVRSSAAQRVGCEATVLRYLYSNHIQHGWGEFVEVDVDGFGEVGEAGYRLAYPETSLAPLAPPHEACDDAEFIASLDRLAEKVGEVA